MEQQTKLRVSEIEKSFPGVKALNRINFSVEKGTVHVLCGENGAGKSTLMKIINGIYQPDSGRIFIDEQPVKIHSPIQARNLGISMIPQELDYVPEMTVEENLFLGRWPKKLGKIAWSEIRKRTEELLKAENLPYAPDVPLKNLSVSDIQMLEIIKAISYESQIIIMDEPTSAISNKEVEILFSKIRELKTRGVSVIYISHKLDEIFRIADEITVMRDGCVVESKPKDAWDIEQVITMMVGRKLTSNYPKEEVPIGGTVLEVRDLSREGVYRNVSFHLKEGEIVGFAGLMGAGRTEVVRSLFGLDPISSGTVRVRGKPVRIRSVRDSVRSGMVMLSEDRRRYGIIPVRSVKENTMLASLRSVFHGGRLHARDEGKTVREIFQKMRVKTPSLETPIESLSGGNQQKVVLAKWIICDPEILILDEPTRGIDVGAKYEIYKLMTELVRQGKTVLMVSSELPELIGMCDRIYVMHQGTLTGELERSDFSQELIMKYATGILKGDVGFSEHKSA